MTSTRDSTAYLNRPLWFQLYDLRKERREFVRGVVKEGSRTIRIRVVQTVAGRVPVLVDGGIRRGTDILKALALGAQAVLIGRPYLLCGTSSSLSTGLAIGDSSEAVAVCVAVSSALWNFRSSNTQTLERFRRTNNGNALERPQGQQVLVPGDNCIRLYRNGAGKHVDIVGSRNCSGGTIRAGAASKQAARKRAARLPEVSPQPANRAANLGC